MKKEAIAEENPQISVADYDSDQDSEKSTQRKQRKPRVKKREKPKEESKDQKIMKMINRLTACGDLPPSKYFYPTETSFCQILTFVSHCYSYKRLKVGSGFDLVPKSVILARI